MPIPIPVPDGIDRASAAFWNPPSLEEQMIRVEPWREDEDFAIGDFSDEEWAVFMQAVKG